MLSGAKMFAGAEQDRKLREYEEKKTEHFNRYVERSLKLLQTGNWRQVQRLFYNIATVLFNEFG